MKVKCKNDKYIKQLKFYVNLYYDVIEYDDHYMILSDGYNIMFWKLTSTIEIDKYLIFEDCFYTMSELRKIKIDKLLTIIK